MALSLGFLKDSTFSNDSLSQNLFHGSMANINIWARALDSSVMTALTSNECKIPQEESLRPDMFAWETMDSWAGSNAYVKKWAKPLSDLCNQQHTTVARLYPIKGTHIEAKKLCESLGGKMAIARDQKHLQYLVDHIVHNTALINNCSSTMWVGATKKFDVDGTKVVDLDGKEVTYLPWDRGNPNGREIQKCISMVILDGKPLYMDDLCDGLMCTLCEIDTKDQWVTLRGPVSGDIDRDYSNNIHNDGGMVGHLIIGRVLRLWRNTLWHKCARFDSLFSPAGLGHLGERVHCSCHQH